jgi:short-subunit dehydrogenase
VLLPRNDEYFFIPRKRGFKKLSDLYTLHEVKIRTMTHILITGASSGIGEALAVGYASPANRLSICGRNRQRLEAVAQVCREKGATVHETVIDVTDKKAMADWVVRADREEALSLVIANAGVGLGGENMRLTEMEIAINVNGVLNTIHPILPVMEERGEGQIVLMSSLAGYVGLPSAPAYSASKNFVRAYGEALRGKYAEKGVKVNVVCPGFVRSRITDQNDFKMPGFMEADQAADIIVRGIKTNKGRIAFPFFMVAGVKFLSILPNPLYEWIAHKLPQKKIVIGKQ